MKDTRIRLRQALALIPDPYARHVKPSEEHISRVRPVLLAAGVARADLNTWDQVILATRTGPPARVHAHGPATLAALLHRLHERLNGLAYRGGEPGDLHGNPWDGNDLLTLDAAVAWLIVTERDDAQHSGPPRHHRVLRASTLHGQHGWVFHAAGMNDTEALAAITQRGPRHALAAAASLAALRGHVLPEIRESNA